MAPADVNPKTAGLLAADPHPLAMEVLYRPDLEHDIETALPHLLSVDAAHLLMLMECKLIPVVTGRALLAANRTLAGDLPGLRRRLRALSRHRGLYLAYEQILADTAAIDALGANHIGRSRNDLNATILRLELRDGILHVLAALLALIRAMIALALDHRMTPLCGFTHGQPAQPMTVAHYFTGVAFELAECATSLAATYELVNRSPMGACAGAGTMVRIEPGRVASYLGLDEVLPNALTAVAGRGFAAAAGAQFAIAGVLLTRVATDLQSWCSHPYDFFRLPDTLVSTSSIMPQKRNAFIFEAVRGRAASAIGALTSVLAGQKNVPFANSIEAGSAASGHALSEAGRLTDAMRLMELLVASLEPQPGRSAAMIVEQLTWVAGAAETIAVRHDIPYRHVHEVFGRTIRDSGDVPPDRLIDAVAGELERMGVVFDADTRAALTEFAGVAAIAGMRHGGGPAPEAVTGQLVLLEAQVAELEALLAARRRAIAEGDARRERAIDAHVGR